MSRKRMLCLVPGLVAFALMPACIFFDGKTKTEAKTKDEAQTEPTDEAKGASSGPVTGNPNFKGSLQLTDAQDTEPPIISSGPVTGNPQFGGDDLAPFVKGTLLVDAKLRVVGSPVLRGRSGPLVSLDEMAKLVKIKKVEVKTKKVDGKERHVIEFQQDGTTPKPDVYSLTLEVSLRDKDKTGKGVLRTFVYEWQNHKKKLKEASLIETTGWIKKVNP